MYEVTPSCSSTCCTLGKLLLPKMKKSLVKELLLIFSRIPQSFHRTSPGRVRLLCFLEGKKTHMKGRPFHSSAFRGYLLCIRYQTMLSRAAGWWKRGVQEGGTENLSRGLIFPERNSAPPRAVSYKDRYSNIALD